MNKIIKTISLMVILSFSVISTNANVETSKGTWDFVEENGIIEVNFNYEVDRDKLELPTDIEYLGFEKGVHYFKALKDLENVHIELSAQHIVSEKENEKEFGNSNDHGKPSESGEGVSMWDNLELGKSNWNIDGELIYSIKIDSSKYKDYKYIIVQDKSENLREFENLEVRMLVKGDNDETITLPNEATYEIVKNEQGLTEIKIELNEGDNIVYDIVYYTSRIDEKEEHTNTYKVIVVDLEENVVTGGSGSGEEHVKEDNPNEDEKPLETPPKTPDEVTEEEPKKDKPIEKEEYIKEDYYEVNDDVVEKPKHEIELPKTGEGIAKKLIPAILIALGIKLLNKEE